MVELSQTPQGVCDCEFRKRRTATRGLLICAHDRACVHAPNRIRAFGAPSALYPDSATNRAAPERYVRFWGFPVQRRSHSASARSTTVDELTERSRSRHHAGRDRTPRRANVAGRGAGSTASNGCALVTAWTTTRPSVTSVVPRRDEVAVPPGDLGNGGGRGGAAGEVRLERLLPDRPGHHRDPLRRFTHRRESGLASPITHSDRAADMRVETRSHQARLRGATTKCATSVAHVIRPPRWEDDEAAERDGAP